MCAFCLDDRHDGKKGRISEEVNHERIRGELFDADSVLFLLYRTI